MNRVMSTYYPTFQMYQRLRDQLLDLLDDQDLGFSPGGANPTLGELCREIGDTQVGYIQSFKTFTHDFGARGSEPEVERSVARLKAWYAQLDQELHAAFAGLSDDDLDQRQVDRGGGFTIPPQIQLEIYKEALLLFYGKASVYLKMLGKTPSTQWQHWVG